MARSSASSSARRASGVFDRTSSRVSVMRVLPGVAGRRAGHARAHSVSCPGRAPVAQWTRASVFGTECRGFESLRARQARPTRPILAACASSSSAPAGTSAVAWSRCSRRRPDLVLMSRDARPLADRFPAARVVAADLLDPATIAPALDGIEVAYYLAHSMGAGRAGFAERDRQAAGTSPGGGAGRDRPDRLSRRAGRRRADLSHHLASRHEGGRRAGRARRAGHRVPGRGHHRVGQRVVRDPAPPDRAAARDDHAPLGAAPAASRSGSGTCSTTSWAGSTSPRSRASSRSAAPTSCPTAT